MASQAVTPFNPQQLAVLGQYNDTEIDLIKRTVAKGNKVRGATDLELAFFLYTARSRNLNPFARQIYAIWYGDQMTLVTGIDGFRSIAARSGAYAGTDRPVFGPTVNSDGCAHPEWAEVTTYKLVQGQRVPFVGYAEWAEFRNKNNPEQWTKQPKNMLAKCAEAQALRKGFPEVLAELEYAEPEPDVQAATTVVVEHSTPTGASTGTAALDPYLQHCPLHDEPWFQSGGMKQPAHRQGDGWCNQRDALNAILVEHAKELEWDNAALQEWTREQFGGKTRSTMTPDEMVAAIRALEGKLNAAEPPEVEDGDDAPPADDGQMAF